MKLVHILLGNYYVLLLSGLLYVLSHFVFIKTWNHVSIAADADQYTMLSCIDQIKQMTKIFMTLSDTKNTNLRNTLYLYTVLADK